MKSMTAFIKQHALLSYGMLTFAISWGAVLLVAGPDNFPLTATHIDALGLYIYLALLAGPAIAGVALTAIINGRAGLHVVRGRLFRWRVGARWYAVALLFAPLSMLAALLALALRSPVFFPSIIASGAIVPLLFKGITVGLLVGFFEELGWTGFAIPQMHARYGVFASGLSVGLLWGLWHFPVFWERDSFAAALPLTLLLARLFSWLPAYRVLLVWVHERTGSLLVVILMHAALVATELVFAVPLALAGVPLLESILAWAAVQWLVVAVLAATNHRRLARRPLAGQMA
jgi:membrane protease YdiL (CAAX protease family)